MKGKRALVCGSTQGIGKAVAITLADLGAEVTLLARNERTLQAVEKELPVKGGQNHGYIACDMMDTDGLRNAITTYLSEHKPFDVLVNNTGGPPAGPAHQAKLSEFESAFRLHLLSHQTLVQALLPGMKSNGSGRIINIISTSVKLPLKGLGVSNTIRGAVANWSKTLAGELGPLNITVNNVLPGATRTERLASIIHTKASKGNMSEEEAAAAMRSSIPMGRFAEPQEVANAVAFLACPAASYINGINVPVDGGRTGCL